jgi:hypothetical protein
MDTIEYLSSDTLSTSGLASVTGTIDVGLNNGNTRIAFAINDLSVFSEDDLIHIVIDLANGHVSIFTLGGVGISVQIDDGAVSNDDLGWEIGNDVSAAGDPLVTITTTPADSPSGAPKATQHIGISLGIGF